MDDAPPAWLNDDSPFGVRLSILYICLLALV
jgi:hypothetical protein